MKLGVPREIRREEGRVAIIPESCEKLSKAGIQVVIENGAGKAAFFSDDVYRAAGAGMEPDVSQLLSSVDMVLMLFGDARVFVNDLVKALVEEQRQAA